jgi:predicted Zn-dependent protease
VRARLALLAVLLAACAQPSSQPQPAATTRQRTVVLAGEDDDARAGQDAARDVEASLGVVRAAKLEAYVDGLGQKLARHAPPRSFLYRFRVVDQWSPNAFALPGGAIFVSRGTLALASSEDELANVLAHEITHAAERHAAARQLYVEALNPFSLGFARAAQIAAYSREQERSADAGGQRIAAAAGYDPAGMTLFLQSLDLVDRLQMGSSRIPTFLDTHPASSERVASTALLASSLDAPVAKDPVAAREAFLEHVDGLVLGADPAEGVVLGSRFLHPDLGFAVSFPIGFEIANTPSAVVAVSPSRDARFALEHAGRGDDPRRAADVTLSRLVIELGAELTETQSLRTECCQTYVVRGRVGAPGTAIAGQIAWVAFEGNVYRLSAAAPAQLVSKHLDRARAMVRSFRPLTPDERASIHVDRLRLVRARGGESIAALSERTDNVFDVHRTAIANGLQPSGVLTEGQLLKIGVREPYRAE